MEASSQSQVVSGVVRNVKPFAAHQRTGLEGGVSQKAHDAREALCVKVLNCAALPPASENALPAPSP
jgi:hypothetical protein